MLPSALTGEFKEELVRKIARSGKLLLCTDFDGTLVSFTGTPSETSLPDEVKELLSELADSPRLHLAVISGRSFYELDGLVPVENATLAGNHGLKIRFEDGTSHELETSEKIHRTISAMKADIEETVGDKPGVIIEDKSFGLALHYRKFNGDKESIKEVFSKIWSEHSINELEVIEGAELLEVRPGNWNKGDAVKLLQQKWGGLPTIYIGDDTTDEDAFRVLKTQDGGIPIIVSKDEEVSTEATYRLDDTGAVRDFLEEIGEIFSEGRGSPEVGT